MKFHIPPHNGQPVGDSERREFLAMARSYLGVPWQHLGQNAQGVDCAGLIMAVIADVQGGIAPLVWDYPPWPNPQAMRDMCNRCLLPIKREEMQAGDVALLYAPGVGVVHLGWYAGKTLIHASNEAHARKVIEVTIHPGWLLRGAYAVPRYEG